jgi:hypothetical protein
VDERRLAAALLERLAGRGKNAEARAADEFQVRQVEHDVLDRAAQHRRELLFKFWRRGRVETAGKTDGDDPRALAADVFLNLDVEWHNGVCVMAR